MTTTAAAPEQIRRRCSKRVYSGQRSDFGGHQCRTMGTVEVDGQWFCGKHSPEGIAKRKAKMDARIEAERAKWRERDEKQAEQRLKLEGYPKLVALLKRYLGTAEKPLGMGELADIDACARSLLRELGEL